MTYQDDEGDQITLNGDSDLITAQELNSDTNSFNLNVRESETKKINSVVIDDIEKNKNIIGTADQLGMTNG